MSAKYKNHLLFLACLIISCRSLNVNSQNVNLVGLMNTVTQQTLIPCKYQLILSDLVHLGMIAGSKYDFKTREINYDFYDTSGAYLFPYKIKWEWDSVRFASQPPPKNNYEFFSNFATWRDLDNRWTMIYGSNDHVLRDGFLYNKKLEKINTTYFSFMRSLGCGILHGVDTLGNWHFLDLAGKLKFMLSSDQVYVSDGKKIRELSDRIGYFPNEGILRFDVELIDDEPLEGDHYILKSKYYGRNQDHRGDKCKLYYRHYDLEGKLIKTNPGLNFKSQCSVSYGVEGSIKKHFESITEQLSDKGDEKERSQMNVDAEKFNQKEELDKKNKLLAPESGATTKFVVQKFGKTKSGSVSVTRQTFSGIAVNAYQTKTTNYSEYECAAAIREVACYKNTSPELLSKYAPAIHDLTSQEQNYIYGKGYNTNWSEGFVYNTLSEAKASCSVAFILPGVSYTMLRAHAVGKYEVKNCETDKGLYTGTMLGWNFEGIGTLRTKNEKIEAKWSSGNVIGTATVTYDDGAKYIGEMKEGRKNGKGTYFWPTSQYEGDWVMGDRTGFGIYRWDDRTVFYGTWIKDNREGSGVTVFDNGSIKKGLWKNDVYVEGSEQAFNDSIFKANKIAVPVKSQALSNNTNNDSKPSGAVTNNVTNNSKVEKENSVLEVKTINYDGGSIYTGTVKEGSKHGRGKYIWNDGSFYDGDWKENERTGYGLYRWTSGEVYMGMWLKGKRHGSAANRLADGSVRKGIWVDDVFQPGSESKFKDSVFKARKIEIIKPIVPTYVGEKIEGSVKNGKGKMVYGDSSIYEGDWKRGSYHGKGKYTWPSGSSYEGDWVDHKRTGFGIYRYKSGDIFAGEWVNNTRTGQGIYIFTSGQFKKGIWKDDVYQEGSETQFNEELFKANNFSIPKK